MRADGSGDLAAFIYVYAVHGYYAHNGVCALFYAFAGKIEHCAERVRAVDTAANLVVVVGVVRVERYGNNVDSARKSRDDIIAVDEVAETVGVKARNLAAGVCEIGDFTISSMR